MTRQITVVVIGSLRVKESKCRNIYGVYGMTIQSCALLKFCSIKLAESCFLLIVIQYWNAHLNMDLICTH